MTEITVNDNGLELPLIGAQVFIEPGQTPEEIDTWFRILKENKLPICRIRLFEVYMRTPSGEWDFRLFDQAFQAAEKYGIKIIGTLFSATAFTDVGGFKFPHSGAHFDEIAVYIKNLVMHFRSYRSLFGWVLINEPGVGRLPDEAFTADKFEAWKEQQTPAVYRSKGYTQFEFLEERFLLEYNTWFLKWLAEEIHKYDPGRHLHVNNHAIFQNVAEYNFPDWRAFLTSLGGSAHASWHFGYFKRYQFALAMSADCEIVRSGAGSLPWLMTEIQGGNNVYSGFDAMCPSREEISQWLWTIIGSGGKGGIFWCLNPRASGFEAGEWALIDFHNQPSDRLQAAAAVSRVIQKNAELFSQAQPIESGLHILYIREALWIERKLQRGGTHYEGREIGGVMKSAMGYFEALSEMGLPCQLHEIGEFDFSKPDFRGKIIILAHQVSLPSRYWKALENFVCKGGKLIVDGLTAYYDENAHCIMKTGFPLEHLFGASVKEFKFEGNLFDVDLTDPNIILPGHCWRGRLRIQSATPIGFAGDEITAVRHAFGKGEVVWIPTLLGLGARLQGHAQLSDFLFSEADACIAAIPFRFHQHYPGLMMKTLRSQAAFVTIIINKSGQPADVELVTPEFLRGYGRSDILFADLQGEVTQPNKVHISPEETLVIRWE